MINYSEICEHYHAGDVCFCIINGKGAVFQKCIYAKIHPDYKEKQMLNCPLKRTIAILERDISLKVREACETR